MVDMSSLSQPLALPLRPINGRTLEAVGSQQSRRMSIDTIARLSLLFSTRISTFNIRGALLRPFSSTIALFLVAAESAGTD